MGLSDTTSHVLWALVVLSISGTALSAGFRHMEGLEEARTERERRIDLALSGRTAEGETFCHDAAYDRVRFSATNLARVPLDATVVTLLADGFPYAVDAGSATWLPGGLRTFVARGIADPPTRVALVLPSGMQAYGDEVECPVLTTLVVTPATATMGVGTTYDFHAQGYDQWGAPYAAEDIAWTTTAGTIVATDADSARLTAGTSTGTYQVTAQSGSVSGSATVMVMAGPPASIEVTPDPAQVTAGGTQTFTATRRDQYGNVNNSAPVTWSTNAGTITSGGVLTAQTTAQTGRQVMATSGALSDAAVVNVVAGPAASVVVTPSTATVWTTRTQTFSATAYDQYGNPLTSPTFTWTATRGTVTSGGLYTAPTSTGADTVSATTGSASGQASVSVKRGVHVEVLKMYKSGVESTSFTKRDTLETRVTVKDHLGAVVQGATVTNQLREPDGDLRDTGSAVTNASGISFDTYNPPGSVDTGTWTNAVTNITGTDLVYDSAANVVTQMTFQLDA